MNQSYTYHYYGMREGLIQTQVFHSFQDSFGYIWFATYEGVSRFDGQNFKNYTSKDLLIPSRVYYINQYKDAIFFVSSKGITFIYADQRIEAYELPDNYRLKDFQIQLVQDDLFLFNCYAPGASKETDLSVFQFDLNRKRFKKTDGLNPFPLDTYCSGDKILAFSKEKDGTRTFFFQIKERNIRLIKTFNTEKKKEINLVRNSKNELLVVKSDLSENKPELFSGLFSGDTLIYTYIMTLTTRIDRLERLDENKLFLRNIHFSGSILEEGAITPFPIPMLIPHHSMIDKEGNLWLSTEEGVYNCHRMFFETYSLGLSHNDNIWSVRKDCYDNIWFSSFGFGIWKADKKGYLHEAQLFHNGKRIEDKTGYMGSCEDETGRIYQPCGKGIAVFDPRNGNNNRMELKETGSSLIAYYDSLTHTVFAGGYKEYSTLNQFNADVEISSYPFADSQIISICRDANQKLRIGTFTGGAWLDEKTKTIIPDTTKRAYRGLISMAPDNHSTLWKGTTDGLFAEDIQGHDTLIANGNIMFVLNYRNTYIIWGVKDYLYLLDLQLFHKNRTVSIRTFNHYSGFDLIECEQNGGYIDKEGYVWVSGVNKAIRFLPEQIMSIPLLKSNPPFIAAIYNANKNTDWSLENRDSLVFENKNNYFRFDILQASVTHPDNLIFRYRLNGFNDVWITTKERSLVFQNIPQGKYRLEIQSSIRNEDWSESVFSPFITIQPPFFLTLPGIILMVAGMLSFIGLIIYFVRKISIRKEEEARQIDQIKHRAVQSKFIPHFTRNVLNSINYLISTDPDLAQKYIVDFAGFSNQTLLNSDKLCWTIEDELNYTESYLGLEKLRFEEKLEYSIAVSPGVDTQRMIPAMILHTFCENAIKHGLRHKPDTWILQIEVYEKDRFLILSVEDNGIGREKAQTMNTEGTREGLKIVGQQIDVFNRQHKTKACLEVTDLFDDARNPAGTRFELHILL